MFTIVTNYTKMLGHVYLNLSYDLIAILNTKSACFGCVTQYPLSTWSIDAATVFQTKTNNFGI
jgi:hypothetical protein